MQVFSVRVFCSSEGDLYLSLDLDSKFADLSFEFDFAALSLDSKFAVLEFWLLVLVVWRDRSRPFVCQDNCKYLTKVCFSHQPLDIFALKLGQVVGYSYNFQLIELEFRRGSFYMRYRLVDKLSKYLAAYQDGCHMIFCTPLYYLINYMVVGIIGWFSYP